MLWEIGVEVFVERHEEAVGPVMGPSGKAELVALFDGDCAVCRRSMAAIVARDTAGRVECVDLRRPEVAARFPDLSVDAVRAQLHSVDGTGSVFIGVDALRQCGSRLPRIRWVVWVLGVPGIRSVAQWVYVLFARHRMRFNVWFPVDIEECSEACAVDWDALEKQKS